jgi:hypothetical protein
VSRLARWLPAATAAAYLATVAVLARGLIGRLYWDTDAAAPLVLAERLRGHGPVYLQHNGFWARLWWLLATRGFPGHRVLWEATGYVFAVAGAALVGWATARVAGRWAGVTAAAITLLVGPLALRSLLTIVFHVSTPFTAAGLAAYLVLLERSRSRPVSFALAAAVGIAAGANAASDNLAWLAAVVPFAVAAALLARLGRRRDVAVLAGVVVATSVVAAVATNAIMHSLGYRIVGKSFPLAAVHDLPGNVVQLGRMVALLGGANYALPDGYPPEPIRIVLALLVCGGVAAAAVSPVLQFVRRASPLALSYAAYWSLATILVGASFVVTTNATALGAGSFNYLLSFAPAAGAGVALLTARSARWQPIVAVAVTAVGAVNIAGLAAGHADTAKGAIGTYKSDVVQYLEGHGATRGYAGYWDAQNLTWQSKLKLLVAPVSRCGPDLCGYNFTTIRSWYDETRGRSFLIVDPTTGFVTEPPPIVGTATDSRRFGPLRVYVFPYDLARHIRPPHA